MQTERQRKVLKNLSWGIIHRFVMILFPFLIRTLIVYKLGTEYLGLESLFTSILQIVSVAELGFSAAVGFSLYQPIALNNIEEASAILAYFRIVYKKIGVVIFFIGVTVLPFLKFLIKENNTLNINIYLLFLIYLINYSLNYILYGYKSVLLTALQRVDIENKILLITNIIQYTLQIIILLVFQNFYLYAFIMLLITIFSNVSKSFIIDKYYGIYIRKDNELSKEIKQQLSNKVKALFIYKMGSVVLKSADNIIISIFLGLILVAKYTNYYYVITMLFSFFAVYYNALRPSIGNVYILNDKSKVIKLFYDLLFIQNWLVGWCSVCLIILYQPFMTFWMGTNMLLPYKTVILLVIYFYVWKIQDVVYIFKEALGIWEADKIRPFIAAIVNLILNLLLVNIIGLDGVIVSTIMASLLIDLPWSCQVLYKKCFGIRVGSYYLELIKGIFITVFTIIITFFISNQVKGVDLKHLLLKFMICMFVPNMLFYLFYKKNPQFNIIKQVIKIK